MKEFVKFGVFIIVVDEEVFIVMFVDVDVLWEFMIFFEGRFIFIRVSRSDIDVIEMLVIFDCVFFM